MRRLSRVVAVVACVVAPGTSAAEAAPRAVTVAAVVDGDTIRVGAGARSRTVDLLGARAAEGCGADGAATLGALLPRGARVRLVRDRGRRGAYVFRGRTFVNGELVSMGAARTGSLRGLRHAGRLRAAQREARTLRLGVWSCDGGVAAPAAGPTAGVDTPANRAELDRFVRGHRFTIRDEFDGQPYEVVLQFCADGRLIARHALGVDGADANGTWQLLGVARRDEQLFLGRLQITFSSEGETETEELRIGRRADGTPVIGDEEDQSPATRAKADAC